jgi:hypothetical protein
MWYKDDGTESMEYMKTDTGEEITVDKNQTFTIKEII